METGGLQWAESDSGEWYFYHMCLYTLVTTVVLSFLSYWLEYKRNNTIQYYNLSTALTNYFEVLLHHHILEANLLSPHYT